MFASTGLKSQQLPDGPPQLRLYFCATLRAYQRGSAPAQPSDFVGLTGFSGWAGKFHAFECDCKFVFRQLGLFW
jgi:hypothetical protein